MGLGGVRMCALLGYQQETMAVPLVSMNSIRVIIDSTSTLSIVSKWIESVQMGHWPSGRAVI